jgi:hypothetical protein
VKVNGVDVFKPQTGEVVSDGADGIACWFIDTDYNEESFFVRHAYFLGANDPYKRPEDDAESRDQRRRLGNPSTATLSRPFDKPSSGRIAVKVINHLGDEVMKVFIVYFTTVTLSTLGYGDLVPTTPWGRWSVVIEVALGLLLTAMLINAIVKRVLR